MSGKRAKQKRREQKQKTKEAKNPKEVVHQITISVLQDKSVAVDGFFSSYHFTKQIFAMADEAVSRHFIQCAKDGRLDEDFNIVSDGKAIPKPLSPVDEGRIIKPTGSNLILPP